MDRALFYEGLELNEVHIDALVEISNIGMGHAATALNQMLGKRISLSIPEVCLAGLDQVPHILGRLDEQAAGVSLGVGGEIKGTILLLFPDLSARSLCMILTGSGPGKDSRFSEMYASVLGEVGNIIASSYLSALEGLLGKTLVPTVPEVNFNNAGLLVENLMEKLKNSCEKALVVKAEFMGEEKSITGHFFLLPDPKSLKIILQAAKVMATDAK